MILSFYLPFFGFILFYLSLRTISLRRKNKVSIGDGGKEDLARAIRAHANFIEYTPLTLLIIAALEWELRKGGFSWNLLDSANIWMHIAYLTLLMGRLSHLKGISKKTAKGRVLGMQLTLWTLILSSSTLLLFKVLEFFMA